MTQSNMWGAIAVLFFVSMDYISGVLKAIMQDNLSSKKMREGLGHKLAYLLLTLTSWVLDMLNTHLSLGFPVSVFICITIGVCMIELTSIIENITAINPELGNAAFMNIFTQNNTNLKHKED